MLNNTQYTSQFDLKILFETFFSLVSVEQDVNKNNVWFYTVQCA